MRLPQDLSGGSLLRWTKVSTLSLLAESLPLEALTQQQECKSGGTLKSVS
jgi:hypothetical protein